MHVWMYACMHVCMYECIWYNTISNRIPLIICGFHHFFRGTAQPATMAHRFGTPLPRCPAGRFHESHGILMDLDHIFRQPPNRNPLNMGGNYRNICRNIERYLKVKKHAFCSIFPEKNNPLNKGFKFQEQTYAVLCGYIFPDIMGSNVIQQLPTNGGISWGSTVIEIQWEHSTL